MWLGVNPGSPETVNEDRQSRVNWVHFQELLHLKIYLLSSYFISDLF